MTLLCVYRRIDVSGFHLGFALVVLTFVSMIHSVGNCADTRFWLSPYSASPLGPEAPNVPGVDGNTRFAHIWAQPATLNSGAWDAATNPFKTLENLSLNLIAENSVVDFTVGSIIVHNPTLSSGAQRFEFVHDSTPTALLPTGLLPTNMNDEILGMQGFNISAGAQYAGIGPVCDPSDQFCDLTNSGSGPPAWLIASVGYTTTGSSGTTDMILQIGSSGMNHAGEASGLTNVIFGLYSGPYNAGPNGDRESRNLADAPDMEAPAVQAATNFRWNGGSGNWTDSNWDLSGAPSWTENAIFESQLGSDIITVNGSREANHSQVDGGELHLASGATLASEVAVGNAGTISGSGFIGSDLALAGKISIGSTNPLRVIGQADLSGGRLSISSSYSQTPGTVSNPFEILVADGGILSTLNNNAGDHLGDGFFLETIAYNAKSVVVQLRSGMAGAGLAGDYNGNGIVDAADYSVWLDSLGQTGSSLPADGNNDQVVNKADYDLWKLHFGSTISSSIEGDFSGNGVVDAADYTIWLDSLGRTGGGLAADGNNDQVVDNADYDLWKGNFGATISGSTSSLLSIPEPAGISLWILFIAAFLMRRKLLAL